MQWNDVISDPSLQDLPYKIELNEYGNIVMSPASNKHSFIQSYIEKQLWQGLSGVTFPECSIQTSKGVKVADVIWCSQAFFDRHGTETPYTKAPEICVEVVSPSDSDLEMKEKVGLYIEAGAKEVWLVSIDGVINYFSNNGQIKESTFNLNVQEMKLSNL